MFRLLTALFSAFCLLPYSPAFSKPVATITGSASVSACCFPPEFPGDTNPFGEESDVLNGPGFVSVSVKSPAPQGEAGHGNFAEAIITANLGESYYTLSASGDEQGSNYFASVNIEFSGEVVTDGPATFTELRMESDPRRSPPEQVRTSTITFTGPTTFTPDPAFVSVSAGSGGFRGSRKNSITYIWGIGDPGPTGFEHVQGGTGDHPIVLPSPAPFTPEGPSRADKPNQIAGINFTFPVVQNYGFDSPIYVASESAGENPIAELSLIAAATAPEPEIIAYEFVAPENGFTFFEIVESLIDDTEFTVTAGDTELLISEGGAIDFLSALGGPVESFTISGIDADLTGDDPLPLVTGVQFASTGSVDFQIVSLGVPEPATAVLMVVAAVGFLTRRR